MQREHPLIPKKVAPRRFYTKYHRYRASLNSDQASQHLKIAEGSAPRERQRIGEGKFQAVKYRECRVTMQHMVEYLLESAHKRNEILVVSSRSTQTNEILVVSSHSTQRNEILVVSGRKLNGHRRFDTAMRYHASVSRTWTRAMWTQ